jgi:hypothetical protein
MTDSWLLFRESCPGNKLETGVRGFFGAPYIFSLVLADPLQKLDSSLTGDDARKDLVFSVLDERLRLFNILV